MRVIVTDRVALKKVRVASIKQYLKRHGWRQSDNDSKGPVNCYWYNDDPEGIEILVPNSELYRDYPQRIADLLSALEKHEGRSQLFILRELRLGRSSIFLKPFVLAVVIALVVSLNAIPLLKSPEGWRYPAWLLLVVLQSLIVNLNILFLIFPDFFFEGRRRENKEHEESS